MSLSEHKARLIENSILDELSASQKEELKVLLESDKEFRIEFELEHEISAAITDNEAADLRFKIGQVLEENRHSGSTWLGNVLKIAAVVAIVFGGYLILQQFSRQDNTQIAVSHFEPYPMMSIERGASNPNDKTLLYSAYSKEDDEAVSNWLKNSREAAVSDLDRIYLGCSFIRSQELTRAINILSKVNENSLVFSASQWYLALAYIAHDQDDMAKPILKRLNETNGRYGVKAKALLEDLNF